MTHVDGQQLAAYWLGELEQGAADALEEHVFVCDPCSSAWTLTREVLAAVQATLPPIISAAQLGALQARHPDLKQVAVEPGGRAVVAFAPGDAMFAIRLKADLQQAERVDVIIEVPDGPKVVEMPAAPFDPETGSVFVLCQRHFLSAGQPLQLRARVNAVERDGRAVEAGVYTLDHRLSL